MKNKKIYKSLELGNILIHPIRYQIIKAIKKKQKLYIQELADILGINRRMVSFHLSTLSQYGFVEGDYEVLRVRHSVRSSKGKVAKYFRITPKVDAVLYTVVERIREIA